MMLLPFHRFPSLTDTYLDSTLSMSTFINPKRQTLLIEGVQYFTSPAIGGIVISDRLLHLIHKLDSSLVP